MKNSYIKAITVLRDGLWTVSIEGLSEKQLDRIRELVIQMNQEFFKD